MSDSIMTMIGSGDGHRDHVSLNAAETRCTVHQGLIELEMLLQRGWVQAVRVVVGERFFQILERHISFLHLLIRAEKFQLPGLITLP